jgi:hypothetical protein
MSKIHNNLKALEQFDARQIKYLPTAKVVQIKTMKVDDEGDVVPDEGKIEKIVYGRHPSIIGQFISNNSGIIRAWNNIKTADKYLSRKGRDPKRVIVRADDESEGVREGWTARVLSTSGNIIRIKWLTGDLKGTKQSILKQVMVADVKPTIEELIELNKLKQSFYKKGVAWSKASISRMGQIIGVQKGQIVWQKKLSSVEKLAIMNAYTQNLRRTLGVVETANATESKIFETKHGFVPVVPADTGELQTLTLPDKWIDYQGVVHPESRGAVSPSSYVYGVAETLQTAKPSLLFQIWGKIVATPTRYDKDYRVLVKELVLGLLGDPRAQIKSGKLLELSKLTNQIKYWHEKIASIDAEVDKELKDLKSLRSKVRKEKKKMRGMEKIEKLIAHKKVKLQRLIGKRQRLRLVVKKAKRKPLKKQMQKEIKRLMKITKIVEANIEKLQKRKKTALSISQMESEIAMHIARIEEKRNQARDLKANKIPGLQNELAACKSGLARLNTVITVPHAMPTYPANEHATDWGAAELAKKVSKLLS